jgi:ribulose-phosphate 3-epimerase
MKRQVAPSVLAADFSNLEKEISLINKSEADWLHCDIMDGVFVPNISFGFPVLQAINKLSTKPMDVHLMIVEPEKYIHQFIEAGAKNLTLHSEICKDLHKSLKEIKSTGISAGISIKPDTPIEKLEEYITEADIFLIMSVFPGFGGQTFIEKTYDRVRKLKAMIKAYGTKGLIEVDGGITEQNAGTLYEAGVDILVTGTTVFHSPDPVQTIARLKKI